MGPSQHRHDANSIANGAAECANGDVAHANGFTNGTAQEAVDTEAGKVAQTATQQIVHGLKTSAAALTSTKPQQPGIASVGDC